MAKPNILFIHSIYGPQGGAEQFLLEQAKILSPHFTLTILYERKTKGSPLFEKEQPLSSTHLSSLLKEWNISLVMVHNCHVLRPLREIYHANTPTIRMVHDHDLYALRPHALLANIRRDPLAPFGIRWRLPWQQRELTRLSKAHDALVVGSRYMRQELVKRGYDPERIHIIPPIPRDLPPPPQVERDPEMILFVGQVVRGKGVDYLLRACAKLSRPWKLVVVGEGNHLFACKKLAKTLDIEGRVNFIGRIPHEELAGYYARASFLAMPSIWPEPFGMVGIEAARYCLPAVGFASGGIPDWLIDQQTGLLVPTGKIPQLASCLGHLLNHPEVAREMGERALELSNEKFNYKLTKGKTLQLVASTVPMKLELT